MSLRTHIARLIGALCLGLATALAPTANAQSSNAATAGFDLTQLNPQVRDAVLQARDAETHAIERAQQARDQSAAAVRNGAIATNGTGLGFTNWNNGDRYVGHFTNGDLDGLGIYTWRPDAPLGTLRYEGDYTHGRTNGYGISYKTDGRRIIGSRDDGHVTGYIVFYNTEGWREEEGQYANGFLNGYGVRWNQQRQVAEQGIFTNGTLTQALTR